MRTYIRRPVFTYKNLGITTLGIVPSVVIVMALMLPTKATLFNIPGHPFSGMSRMSMPMVESSAAALSLSAETPINRTGWTAIASDEQAGYPASAVLDGSTSTIWHSNYATEPDVPLPHTMTIDMKRVHSVSRVTYTPRQSGQNGQVGKYEIYLSLDGVNWGNPVTSGLWADSPTDGAKPAQFADFSTAPARYVRLKMLTEAGNRGPWSSIAELQISGSTQNTMAMPDTNWTAIASDSQVTYPVSNILDNNDATFWHSNYAPTPDTPLPHSVTVDTKSISTLEGFSYVPRQDGVANGRIGQYQLAVSTDNAAWTTVKSGTWADDPTEKGVSFSPVEARYVRLTALTEAGNRGPWSSIAGISLYDTTKELPMYSRVGWTATASDASAGYPASNVLDGNSQTIWHSNFDTTPDMPLPHALTIDMKQSQLVTAFTYAPRQDTATSRNGTIGAYTIETSVDGANWQANVSGFWADSPGLKTVRLMTVSARYVRLTALTEAGNRGPWTTASEVYVHGADVSAEQGGSWGNPIGFPLVPTMAAVLPNNKLLVFSAYTSTNFNRTGDAVTKIAILDLNTNSLVQPPDVNTNHQMFCSGTTLLADGRLLINGGSADAATTIYNPFTNIWTKGPLMTTPRAYQATTILSNGNVFTLGGSWDDPNNTGPNRNGEIFTPSGTTGSWKALPGVTASNILTNDPGGRYRADNHAWLFASSNGSVFQAGPSKQMNWITTVGSGTISAAGVRGNDDHAMNGTAVMYDTNEIVTMGGAAVYQDIVAGTTTQAHRNAYQIDISKGPGVAPSVTSAGTMAYQRAFNNSVVLPDGNVLTVGGQQHPEPFADTAAAMVPELWQKAVNGFTKMAAQTIPRNYHSVALLLPDGRVFSGGGGLCGGCSTNHTDGQIYTPPYLLNTNGTLRARPTITSTPTTITRGSSIAVTTSGNTPSFALIRMSATTHTVNADQRRISLTPSTVSGNTYTLPIPGDSGVTLPGYYMLFALDANGTPSVAKIVKI